MANERIPNDPYRADDLTRPDFDPDAPYRRSRRLDNEELQADPELVEGRASSARIAIFALAIAIILGAVFYGLNNSSVHQNGTSTAQNPASPPATSQTTTGANKGPATTSPAPPPAPPAPAAPASPPK